MFAKSINLHSKTTCYLNMVIWQSLSVLMTILLQHKIGALYRSCPDLYFYSLKTDTVCISENANISLTFWLNTSLCEDIASYYRLEIQTLKSDGTSEFDGRLAHRNNRCLITYKNTVHCISGTGPAVLYKTLNSSDQEIVWRWSWTDNASRKMENRQRTLKLNASCPDVQEKSTDSGYTSLFGTEVSYNDTVTYRGKSNSFFLKRADILLC
ncbi:uncharacterized protein LOC112567787 [Pomacea canaliculata]|uniref:uncharacterized protein LOC112567787 n=1 Tax=Pomacea canaliculata TaxID=400727 RepID=UPI000D72D6A3|nr:uncharacterized protein LOC112567787 [Pomacea canaliculata]